MRKAVQKRRTVRFEIHQEIRTFLLTLYLPPPQMTVTSLKGQVPLLTVIGDSSITKG